MERKLKFFHLVCPNGIGHFKRTVEIWSKLTSSFEADVVIACEQWQMDRFSDYPAFKKLIKSNFCSFRTFDLSSSLGWKKLTKLSFDLYKEGMLEVFECEDFKNADLVLSDNLLLPLAHHPKVIIIGSFLWHDVLKNSEDARLDELIYQEEAHLLELHKPVCVSVNDVTMPVLLDQENHKSVNWFCTDVIQRNKSTPKGKNKVLFTSGLSNASTNSIRDLLEQFRGSNAYSVFVTPVLFEKIEGFKDDLNVFDFSEESFQEIDLIVARPGVGAITETIKFQIPMIAIDNGENSEMIFNAAQVQKLDFGWDAINQVFDISQVLSEYNMKLEGLKLAQIDGFKELENIIKENI